MARGNARVSTQLDGNTNRKRGKTRKERRKQERTAKKQRKRSRNQKEKDNKSSKNKKKKEKKKPKRVPANESVKQRTEIPEKNVSSSKAFGIQPEMTEDDIIIGKYEQKLGVKGDYWKSKSFTEEGLGEFHDLLAGLGATAGFTSDLEHGGTGLPSDSEQHSDTNSMEDPISLENDLEMKDAEVTIGGVENSDVVSDTDESCPLSKKQAARARRDRREALYGSGVAHTDDEMSDSEDSETEERPAKRVKFATENTVVNFSPDDAVMTPSIAVAGKYIPPQFRKQASDTEDFTKQRLRRQVKGLVNKLSESNIEPITQKIVSLYDDSSRHDMNECLVDSITVALKAETALVQSVVVALAAMITSIHAQIDTQVGAFFLEKLIFQFQEEYKKCDNKMASNILLLIVNLYNFQMMSCGLIYDIVGNLCETFTALDVELIHLILKHCGFRLRKDDPGRFKEILLSVQSKSRSIDTAEYEKAGGSVIRVQVILDLILDLKNNKRRAAEQQQQDALAHMRKWVAGVIKKRAGNDVDRELHISWADFMNAETKGRWWIVGSAWKGGGRDLSSSEKKQKSASSLGELGFSDDLLRLATRQRMSTDLKKAIFCVVMGSEDCSEAFEKLVSLTSSGTLRRFSAVSAAASSSGGSESQKISHAAEKDVISVLLACCGQEKRYNPYYALLLSKICTYYRSYQFTVQLAYWDIFKEFPSLLDTRAHKISLERTRHTVNLARMFAHLLCGGILSWRAFKPVAWDALSPQMNLFMFSVFGDVFRTESKDSLEALFGKLTTNKFRDLRDGIFAFFQLHVLSNLKASDSQVRENLEIAQAAMRKNACPT
eukprot:451374_1